MMSLLESTNNYRMIRANDVYLLVGFSVSHGHNLSWFEWFRSRGRLSCSLTLSHGSIDDLCRRCSRSCWHRSTFIAKHRLVKGLCLKINRLFSSENSTPHSIANITFNKLSITEGENTTSKTVKGINIFFPYKNYNIKT